MNKEKISIKILEKGLDLDRRAFLKKYAKNLKGPGKITILVFFICKGKKQSLSSNEIKSQWNKSKSILGKYNPAYLVRAREYGFLKEDKTKKRHYILRSSWLDEFSQRYNKLYKVRE